jgi:hypothetical protein
MISLPLTEVGVFVRAVAISDAVQYPKLVESFRTVVSSGDNFCFFKFSGFSDGSFVMFHKMLSVH